MLLSSQKIQLHIVSGVYCIERADSWLAKNIGNIQLSFFESAIRIPIRWANTWIIGSILGSRSFKNIKISKKKDWNFFFEFWLK